MSCLGSAWCPKCHQIISSSCICMLICDIHGRVCTTVVPDGVHDVRREHSADVTKQCREYRNGWEIGFIGGKWDGKETKWIWMTREPGHPTKSPRQVWLDEMAEAGRQSRANYEAVFEVRNDGGGI